MEGNKSILGFTLDELTIKGGIHTATEISQQPEIWGKVWSEMNEIRPSVNAFLQTALPAVKRIILTGAGTSAFIGVTLRGAFQRETGIVTEAIASTDIVTHPENYLLRNEPVLMISFARSGNSPESSAVLRLTDSICKNSFHLIITCNGKGELALYPSNGNKMVIVLPPEANDASLVMTSSFTGMLLAGLLVARIKKLEHMNESMCTLMKLGRDLINEKATELKLIASCGFERIVFLGAGCNFGLATEAALKMQELTDGKIICKKDTFLGFRHGPKAVIDDKTLMVYFISSNNPYAYQYEKDLIESREKGTQPFLNLSISATKPFDFELPAMIYFANTNDLPDDELLAICYIVPVQILGFYKALQFGISPDNPSFNQDISRVVEGVQIYSHL